MSGNRQVIKEAKPFTHATLENAGTGETDLTGLITRRSEVQILPPPPSQHCSRSEALSVKREGPLLEKKSDFRKDIA